MTGSSASARRLRDLALPGHGVLTVTEVCFTVGGSSLGTFGTRFTELVRIQELR